MKGTINGCLLEDPCAQGPEAVLIYLRVRGPSCLRTHYCAHRSSCSKTLRARGPSCSWTLVLEDPYARGPNSVQVDLQARRPSCSGTFLLKDPRCQLILSRPLHWVEFDPREFTQGSPDFVTLPARLSWPARSRHTAACMRRFFGRPGKPAG